MAAVAAVEMKLVTIENARQSQGESIQSLRLIHITGKLELANFSSERLVIIFDNIHGHLKDAEGNLSVLERLIQDLARELHKGLRHSGPIEQAVARIDPGALYADDKPHEPVVPAMQLA